MTGEAKPHERLAGLSFSEALRRALLNDEDIIDVVERGQDVPAGEMVWLDALRRKKLPSLWWSVEAEHADFGICDLTPFRDDPKKSGNPHMPLLLQNNRKIVYSDFVFDGPDGYSDQPMPATAIFVNGELDVHQDIRNELRSAIKSRYKSFLYLLQNDQLVAEAWNPAASKTVIIDKGLWRQKRFFFNFVDSDIYESRELLANPIFESVALRLPTFEHVRPTPSQDGRGRRESTNWEQVAKHFCISLYDDDWPEDRASAVKRIVQVMQHLGIEAPAKSDTISNAMFRHIAPLWDLFPTKQRRGDNRFYGLTETPTKAGRYES